MAAKALKVQRHTTSRTDCLLIGAGGHAKAVVEAAIASIGDISAYVDPREVTWLGAENIPSDDAVVADGRPVILGLGGATVAQLKARLALLQSYLDNGHPAPVVAHAQAHVSAAARLESGCIVLAGAIVQPGAVLQRGVIVNTGAIVEHDCKIDEGAHVAPGAIILGECQIGKCAMIGAGAVILPGAAVADCQLVPALTRYGGPS